MYLRTPSADVSLPGSCAGSFRVGSGGICAGDRRCDRKRGGVWLRHLCLSGNIAATRDPKRLSALISGVLGAKVLLAMVCIAGAVFSRRFTHHVAPSLALFWASTIWGVCQGINMLWFFQGLERMRLASVLEIGGKVLATLSIFLLVHKPEDGWKVMGAQCVGCVVAHGVTVVLAYREVGFQWPTPSSVWNALRLGGSMFLFRAVESLSGAVNRLVLGTVAPVAVLGEYAGAERITRVFQQGMWPVNQALYPKMTQQAQNNPGNAMKTVRLSLLFLGALGMIFGLAIFFGAPLLVHLVLGQAFQNSVPVLRVFALWIPLVALSTVIIFQLLLPNQLEQTIQHREFHFRPDRYRGCFSACSQVQCRRHRMVGGDRADLYLGRLLRRVGASRVESFCAGGPCSFSPLCDARAHPRHRWRDPANEDPITGKAGPRRSS